MGKTKIEWTDTTWNVATGCEKISEGCKHCYAEKMHSRLRGIGNSKYQQPFNEVRCWNDLLDLPRTWKKSKHIFVNSMSDLFHKDVPFEFIDNVFETMILSQQHIFQILTKRPDRMLEFFNWAKGKDFDYTNTPFDNIWLGVTVESDKQFWRIEELIQIPAAVRFISCEPLLGNLDLNKWLSPCGYYCDHEESGLLDWIKEYPETEGYDYYLSNHHPDKSKLDWVIAGGETGNNSRPMHPDWVRSLRDQCQAANVPFFFKGWGEWIERNELEFDPYFKNSNPIMCGENGLTFYKFNKKITGRLLDRKEWNQFPIGDIKQFEVKE